MRRARGFTLIELLVVIGIIGVLVSILLPTLAKVRQQALNTNCASNLRQIAIACTAYAAEFKGYLPARFREGKDPFYQPLYTYFPQDVKVSPPARYGLGLLWERKYLRPEQVFYCPGGRAHPLHNLDSFPAPWLSDTGQNYRTSYSYNPHYALQRPGDINSPKITAYPRLGKFPRTKVLATDLIRTYTTISHYGGGERTPSWNLAFTDGHVVLIRSKLLFDEMKRRGGDLGSDGGNPQATSNANWLLLDDYRDILETIAEGRHPGSTPQQLQNRVKH